MTKAEDSDLRQRILDYLMQQNRPFSANDIFGSGQIEGGKAAKLKALDHLVKEGKVKEKSYGKQKVFFAHQNLFGDAKDADLASMDAEIGELTNKLDSLQKQIRHSEGVLDDLNGSLPTAAAIAELQAVNGEIASLEAKLKKLESKSLVLDVTEKKTLCESKEKYSKLDKRRKRIANDVIEAILEGYPKSKRQLLEDIGIEEEAKKC